MRQRRRAGEDDIQLWDASPRHYTVNGVEREFFVISDVAKAIGYSVHSIRAWETAGLFPPATYRSPRTRGPVAGGHSNKGKRLWTRKQIQAILRIAKKHKVLLNRKPPTAAFAREVDQAFAALVDE